MSTNGAFVTIVMVLIGVQTPDGARSIKAAAASNLRDPRSPAKTSSPGSPSRGVSWRYLRVPAPTADEVLAKVRARQRLARRSRPTHLLRSDASLAMGSPPPHVH